MPITVEEIDEKMFKPVFHYGRGLEEEITYESAKKYMCLLVQDAKDKMKELFPTIKYKIAVIDQKSTKQFFVICSFLIEGNLFYLFNNLSWDMNADNEYLHISKITQVDNNG
jgi:hypothetical protein